MEKQALDTIRRASWLVRALYRHPVERDDLIKRLSELRQTMKKWLDREVDTGVLMRAIFAVEDVLVPYKLVSLQESAGEIRLINLVRSDEFTILGSLAESRGTFSLFWDSVCSAIPGGPHDWKSYSKYRRF